MNRNHRLIILGLFAAFGWGVPSIFSSYLFGQLTDSAAKATVLAALIALFGVFFTAIFSEISAYYKDRGLGMQKKWELIFPMLRDYYNPWIQSAKYLSDYLGEIKDSHSFSAEQAARALFYLTLFFSQRLQFSLRAGGRPILAEDKDQDSVLEAYREVEKALDWKGPQTPNEVSFLQNLYIQKNKPKKPYLSFQFVKDAETKPRLRRIRDEFQAWLNKERADAASIALNEFQTRFKNGINKLYSGWAS